MIDATLISVSISSLSFFILALTLVVRKRGTKGILVSMKQLFLALSLLTSAGVWGIYGSISLDNRIQIVVVHLLLFWLLSFSYIIGLFGLPLTSMRIQLLLTIFQSGKGKLRRSDLMKQYTKRMIVEQRLWRLETSGEIVKNGNVYSLRSRWSYFMVHTYFLMLLTRLYRPIQSTKRPI